MTFSRFLPWLLAAALLGLALFAAGPCLAGEPSLRTFRVTAYCPCEKCCGKHADGITASGTRADHPLVAAPRSYPFGTAMQIPGYAGGRWVRDEDRGGAIKGNRLDVLFAPPWRLRHDKKAIEKAHNAALRWGVRWVKVKTKGGGRCR